MQRDHGDEIDPILQQDLVQWIGEVVETFATFDDRLAVERLMSEDAYLVTFTSGHRSASTTVRAFVKPIHDVEVLMASTEGIGIEVRGRTVVAYSGAFEKPAIWQQVGVQLADWYGTVIRTLPHGRP